VPDNIHERTGGVSHDEARRIAQKFIDNFFNSPGKDRPRASIPADPTRDDDLRLCAYIARQQAVEAALIYSLEQLLEHIEWRRGRDGLEAGPNDCTHRARAALEKAKAA
jgi:hypothetical protein